MRLTHLIPGSIAYEIPGHVRGLGRQILPHEIRLSRTQIGLPPNLGFIVPRQPKKFFARKTAMVISGINDLVTRLGSGRWLGSV
jgi:hypothetical protein